jgi:hypothetical protein
MSNDDSKSPAGPSPEPPPEDFAQSGEAVEIRQATYSPKDLGLDADKYPSELLEARAALEEVLRNQSDQRSGVRSAENLTEETNVQGVGIGQALPAEYGPRSSSIEPGQATLAVYLAEPRHADDVEHLLVERMGIGAAASRRVPIVPVVTGLIRVQAHDFRMRPAPGGISLNSVPNYLEEGTAGFLATGRSFPRNLRTLIVSCNHVIANGNGGALGDCVTQPAKGDGGVCLDANGNKKDLVAVLEKVVTIDFAGPIPPAPINVVDCATAWADPADVSAQIVQVGAFGPETFPVSSTTVAAVPNVTVVGKSGKVTQLTSGVVREVGLSFYVGGYPGGNSAFFSGGIGIQGNIGPFSMEGDSGALVWTFDLNLVRNPVGLLFAGAANGVRSFASPIDIVLMNLDIFMVV